MANEDDVRRLKAGVQTWNLWAEERWTQGVRMRPQIGRPLTEFPTRFIGLADLSEADLSGMNLVGVKLHSVDLVRANLSDTMLSEAEFIRSDLSYANLARAVLTGADLSGTTLSGTNFRQAQLDSSVLLSPCMDNTDLTGASLADTIFSDVNLASVIGLDTCDHRSSSIVDFKTLQRSGILPLPFLRGVGLPDALIEYLPSLLNQPIQYYSCFISYSTINRDFCNRIHADLQNSGVRCWFAHHDMPIGAKILNEIDAAIRLRDKLLLVLSEHSIASSWVEDEVTAAFEEERRRGDVVIFPIRLDEAVMEAKSAWAAKLRGRHIGDFTRWKDHEHYWSSFQRMLHDLRA